VARARPFLRAIVIGTGAIMSLLFFVRLRA